MNLYSPKRSIVNHSVAIGNEEQSGGVNLWLDLINHVEIAVIGQQHAASDSEAPVAVQHYWLHFINVLKL